MPSKSTPPRIVFHSESPPSGRALSEPEARSESFSAEYAHHLVQTLRRELSHFAAPPWQPSADQIRRALPDLVRWVAEMVANGQVDQAAGDEFVRTFAGLALERQIGEYVESSVFKTFRPDSVARQIALWHERRHAE